MEKHEFLPDFDEEDIIQFCLSDAEYPSMMKLSRLREAVSPIFEGDVSERVSNRLKKTGLKVTKVHDKARNEYFNAVIDLFADGVQCEMLKLGTRKWQSGKIRIRLAVDFIPDESIEESPLHEIRQEIATQEFAD